jgi:hypothetical protein
MFEVLECGDDGCYLTTWVTSLTYAVIDPDDVLAVGGKADDGYISQFCAE